MSDYTVKRGYFSNFYKYSGSYYNVTNPANAYGSTNGKLSSTNYATFGIAGGAAVTDKKSAYKFFASTKLPRYVPYATITSVTGKFKATGDSRMPVRVYLSTDKSGSTVISNTVSVTSLTAAEYTLTVKSSYLRPDIAFGDLFCVFSVNGRGYSFKVYGGEVTIECSLPSHNYTVKNLCDDEFINSFSSSYPQCLLETLNSTSSIRNLNGYRTEVTYSCSPGDVLTIRVPDISDCFVISTDQSGVDVDISPYNTLTYNHIRAETSKCLLQIPDDDIVVTITPANRSCMTYIKKNGEYVASRHVFKQDNGLWLVLSNDEDLLDLN